MGPVLSCVAAASLDGLGILELVGTVGLIIPAAFHWPPTLTVVAATVLAIENLVFVWVLASTWRIAENASYSALSEKRRRTATEKGNFVLPARLSGRAMDAEADDSRDHHNAHPKNRRAPHMPDRCDALGIARHHAERNWDDASLLPTG
jgi:hypothetical protein